jgi:hypothetical protein
MRKLRPACKKLLRGPVLRLRLALLASTEGGVVGQQGKMLARGITLACVGCSALNLLTGCGLSTLTSGLNGGMFGSSSTTTQVKAVTEEQLLSAAKADYGEAVAGGGDIAHGCPRFTAWPRENYVTVYEHGRMGDGLAVVHRGEITKTARECQIEPGRVTVRYGFSGRVLLGPRGKSGNVSLPVNVFVADAKRERIATDKMNVDVFVAVDRPIGYFSLVRTVTFNIPEGSRPGEFEVFVGFDRTVPGAG